MQSDFDSLMADEQEVPVVNAPKVESSSNASQQLTSFKDAATPDEFDGLM